LGLRLVTDFLSLTTHRDTKAELRQQSRLELPELQFAKNRAGGIKSTRVKKLRGKKLVTQNEGLVNINLFFTSFFH